MQGASPTSSHRDPETSMTAEQHSAPVKPGRSPQPTPPHIPQAASQQTPLSVSSYPAKPLLHVVFSVATVFGIIEGNQNETEHVTGSVLVATTYS